VRLSDQEILVAFREGRDHWKTRDGVVKVVRSRDRGHTWGEPRTVLEVAGRNLGTHLSMILTDAGTLLCAYRETKPYENRGVGLSYSLDGGQTWVEQAAIYRATVSPDCGYPSMVNVGDNTVFCAYYTEAVNDTCHIEGVLLEEGY